MKNDEPRAKDVSLESMIETEAEAAVDRFRKGNFEAALRARIGEIGREEQRHPRRPVLSLPAWSGIAAGLLIVAVGFALFYRPAPKANLARSIEKALRLAPGIEGLEAGLSDPGQTPATVPDALDAVHLAAALAAGARSGDAGPAGKESAPPRGPGNVRPLSLEEIYKIVSIDKSIERVLALITS